MDNLTHSLTGLVLARAGLGRATRGATAALVLSSNLPDIDVVAGLQGATAYLQHHRDLSHSVVGAPILALALAAVLRGTLRGSRFVPLLVCSLFGIVGHVLMDLCTSYGTRVLSPFDRTWYAWDLLFIVDPFVLVLLAVSLMGSRTVGPRLAAACLGMVLAYGGGRAVLHARALDEAVARVASGTVIRAAALPSALNPLRWRVLLDTGATYWTGQIRLDGPSTPLVARRKTPETGLVTRVRETSAVASIFLDFSRFPWLEIEDTSTGTAVTWKDLRFENGRRESFVTRVLVGPDGSISSETFRF